MNRLARLVLIRHGQSVWNAENRFTGWTDVELSEKGEKEAAEAGEQLADFAFDVIHTSALIRAQRTAVIIMQHNRASGKIPTREDQRLNERHYGALQGLNKAETAEKHGAEQVHIWRRSFDVAPPEGESLELTAARTIPYFQEVIMPSLNDGNCIFITAHGNSLRSIIMYLDDLSREEVLSLEVPTGQPIIYEMIEGKLQRK